MVLPVEGFYDLSVYDASAYGVIARPTLGAVPPRFRIYDPSRLLGPLAPVVGQLGASGVAPGGGAAGGGTGGSSAASGSGSTQVVTFPQPPQAGDLLIVVFAWDSLAGGLGAAGWTEADQQNSATAAGGIWYRIAAAGDPQQVTFTTTAGTNWVAVTTAYRGAAASPLDVTQTSTGTSATPTTGTTAATAQADEVALALLVTGAPSDGALCFSSGYLEIARVSGPDFTMILGQRMLNATGTQQAAGTSRTLAGYAGVIATFKAAASRPAFAPLGEFAFATGSATMRPYDLGEFELRASTAEPATNLLGPNTIVEAWQPDDRAVVWPAVNGDFETDTSGWTTAAGSAWVAGGATATRSTAIATHGAASMNVATTGTQFQGVRTVLGGLTAGVTYTVHLDVAAVVSGGSATDALVAWIGEDDAGSYTAVTDTPDGNWHHLTASWVATADTASLGIRLNTGGGASVNMWIDSVVLIAGPRAGFTLGWYLVRHLERDESTPVPVVTVRGPDLRALITDRPLVAAVLDDHRGSPPADTHVENWVRAYVTSSTITVTASNDYPTADVVPLLALEASSGNRGTDYADAPGKTDASLGETITTLYRRDQLGWRLVITNPGQTTAAITFETFAGTDRTMGQASEAVFCTQWETARACVWTDDALPPASTSLTVLGPPAPVARTPYYVEDPIFKQRWGQIAQRVDGSQDAAADLVPGAYLAELSPKQFVTVHTRPGRLAPLRDYAVLDRVTAVLRDGTRVDDVVTALSLSIRPGDADVAEFGLIAAETDTGSGAAEIPAAPSPFDPLVPTKVVIGTDPSAVKMPPPGLPTYSDLTGMTSTVAELNALDGVTVAAADLNKTSGMDAAATRNPTQAAAATFNTVGSQTVSGVSAPGATGGQTVSTAPGSLAAAVDQTELNGILATLVTDLNAVKTALATAGLASSAQTAVNNVQTVVAQHQTANNDQLAKLGTAGAKVLGN